MNLCYVFTVAVFISFAAQAKPAPLKYWNPLRLPSSLTKSSQLSEASTLALQRVLKSENQRIEKDPYLLQAVFHSSTQVSKAALLALGRVGDPYAIETLAQVLSSKDTDKKPLAAFSLGLIGDEFSLRILTQNIAMEKNSNLRAAYYRALGLTRQLQALSVLARALTLETETPVLIEAAKAIGILISEDSANWIVTEATLQRLGQLCDFPGELGLSAAFALTQYKGDPGKIPFPLILQAISKKPPASTQVLLIRALARKSDPQVTTSLIAVISGDESAATKAEAVKSLKGKKIPELSLPFFKRLLGDSNASLVVATLETLEESPVNFKPLVESVVNLFQNSPSRWVKGRAIKALCRLDADIARPLAHLALKSPDSSLVASALTGLVSLNLSEETPTLLAFLKEGDPRFVSEMIESLSNLPSDSISPEIQEALKSLLIKKDPGIMALVADLAKQKGWKDFATPLANTYSSLKSEDSKETKVALLASLGALGTKKDLGLLHSALNDNSRQVIQTALEAIKSITGKEIPIRIPLNNRVIDSPPSYPQWNPVLTKRAILNTTRGAIELAFFKDTPITAYRFVEFAKSHFYDGKIFHRLVPNYVVQGGDPRGDGFGGPGFLIRDEFSPVNHNRGTVGIATSGKDTGGCQFFFNLASNFQLNGRYTVFAEVVSGMDVVDKLEVGDKILSVKIQ
jgi:cyclophilin family peptidyl-prolyl cis-trans isomerase/HEAT repeat protein